MRLIKLWGVKVRINIVQNGVEISGEGKSSEEIGNAITVSRLVPWKRIDRSLRLCSKLNLSLTIVGDGEQRQLLEAEANDLGLRVKFLGQVSGEQVQKLLNRHSIFCLLSEYEGQSFALTEALSKGLFCIVSEAEGNTAIIKHLENGFIFGENDFEKSILELGEILRDSNLVAKIRMQAQRDAVEYYSEEARFLEVKELLEYLE
jgi:glycosyltransferase involved in cell wall biosynthesis